MKNHQNNTREFYKNSVFFRRFSVVFCNPSLTGTGMLQMVFRNRPSNRRDKLYTLYNLSHSVSHFKQKSSFNEPTLSGYGYLTSLSGMHIPPFLLLNLSSSSRIRRRPVQVPYRLPEKTETRRGCPRRRLTVVPRPRRSTVCSIEQFRLKLDVQRAENKQIENF